MSDTATRMPPVRDVSPTRQRAAAVQQAAIISATKRPVYERWLEYHKAHPKVYRALEGLALYALRHNPPRKFGIKALYEIARWERRLGFKKEDGEEWKLPNEYTSLYARLLAEQHPEFLGDESKGVEPYFELRSLRSAEWTGGAAARAERTPPPVEP